MSGDVVAILFGVVIWLATGVVLSVVMGRRGHYGAGWGVLGAMLGPFAVVAALATVRLEGEERPSVVVAGASHGGPVDVLVGIDGSPECALAVERAVTMLGPRLGRLTLATAVAYDDVAPHTTEILRELDRRARLSGVAEVGQEVLHGQPARALAEFATGHGYDLLVVGTRGRGMAKAIMGSTASALAAGCAVPVLMVGDEARMGRAAA